VPADSPGLPFDIGKDSDAPDPSANYRQDVDEAMRMLVWARKQGFELSSLRIGSVILPAIRDVKPIDLGAPPQKLETPVVDLFDQMRRPGEYQG
jgi:hypothetical protein